MLVWITGAKGFIGQHLARHLAAQGHTVVGLGHGLWPDAAAQAGLSLWINGAITGSNLNSLRLAHGLPELVVHLAGGSSVSVAMANPLEDFSRTVASTAALLEWLRQESPQSRLVVVSSAAVHGGGHDGRIAETAPLRPFSPYGYHKLMMEQLCRSYGENYGLPCVALRLFSVYGPGLRKQLLWELCQRMAGTPSALELSGTGLELRDWMHIDDVVRVIDATSGLAAAAVPTFNVGTGTATPVRDIARIAINAYGESSAGRELRFNGSKRAGDPFSLVADPARLQALGFEFRVPLHEGIAGYVNWFRTQRGAGLGG